MDFSNRDTHQPISANPGPANPGPAATPASRRHHDREPNNKWLRIGFVVAVIAVVVLIVAAILVVSSSNSNTDNEGKYVYSNKLQAVFLNTGQVYFGNIKVLNDKYFVLTNIYYLQTSSGSSTTTTSTSASNVSLVKLGCELHQPYDEMVINRDQVTFWENLEDTGQVAKAVAAFQKANPNGQTCTDQSSSASTTTGTAAQSAGTASATGTATTGTTDTSTAKTANP
jgi:hypothetical protein